MSTKFSQREEIELRETQGLCYRPAREADRVRQTKSSAAYLMLLRPRYAAGCQLRSLAGMLQNGRAGLGWAVSLPRMRFAVEERSQRCLSNAECLRKGRVSWGCERALPVACIRSTTHTLICKRTRLRSEKRTVRTPLDSAKNVCITFQAPQKDES